jgi:hypothetical protein
MAPLLEAISWTVGHQCEHSTPRPHVNVDIILEECVCHGGLPRMDGDANCNFSAPVSFGVQPRARM